MPETTWRLTHHHGNRSTARMFFDAIEALEWLRKRQGLNLFESRFEIERVEAQLVTEDELAKAAGL